MQPAHPYTLLLLVIPPILALVALIAAGRKRREWAAFVADRLRSKLIKRSSPLPRWLAFFSLLLAIFLMILGLSRMQFSTSSQTENSRGRNLMIVLDLSRSMQVEDLKPSRLAQAKALVYELLETLPNDRIGVIGFSSVPFLFAPLTTDHGAVKETVEQLDYDSIPTGGSDIGAAVMLAITTLKETAQSNNGLLILSDGEEHSPKLLDTIEEIKKSGTYVFAVGIGTDDGGFIPDKTASDGRFRDNKGNVVISRLQTATLRDFAARAAGRFALAQSAAEIPAMVAAAVSDLESFEMKGREKMLATELFQWFILPAVLLLMTSLILGTRWRSLSKANAASVLVLLLALFLHPMQAATEPGSLDSARAALQAGAYQSAREQFEELAAKEPPQSEDFAGLQLGKATADYRLNDFPAARASYSKALTNDDSPIRAAAHQGMGNTLFQLGWQSLAKGENYPGEKAAAENFDKLVKERIDEWMKSEETDSKAPSEGYRNFQTIMLNWADAVRHSQSALSLQPGNQEAEQNKRVAQTYLEKLRKAMEQQQQEMQAQMEGQGEGEGQQPNPGESGEGGDKEGEKGKDGKEKGDGGDGGKDPKDQGKDGEKDPNGKTPDGEKPDPNNTHGKDRKPEETKEQNALRKLNENADLQRGIVAPGTYNFRRPEKDW